MTLADHLLEENGEVTAYERALLEIALLHLESDHASLVRLHGRQLLDSVRSSVQQLNTIHADGQFGSVDVDISQVSAIRDSLTLTVPILEKIVATCKPPGGSNRFLSELIWDTLDLRASRTQDDRRKFRDLCASAQHDLDKLNHFRAQQATEMIVSAFTETGVERREALREAMKPLREIMGEVDPSRANPSRLQYGWLLLSTYDDAHEAALTLSCLARTNGQEPSVVSASATKLLSHARLRLNEPDSAFVAAMQCTRYRADESSLLNAVRIAVACGREVEGRQFLENALFQSPLVLADALAADPLPDLLHMVLPVLEAQKRSVFEHAQQHFGEWNKTFALARRTESECGIRLNLPARLTEEPREALRASSEPDILIAMGAKCAIAEVNRELKEQLRAEICNQELRLEGEVKTKREAMDKAWNEREAAVRKASALSQNSAEEWCARKQLSISETDRAQQGWSLAMGLGCGTMFVSVGATALLNLAGLQVALNSPVGLAAIGMAGLPIISAVAHALRHGVKTAAEEAELTEKRRLAQAAYEQSSRAADEQYQRSVAGIRQELAAADERLQQIRNARRMVSESL